eukprot:gene10407-2538_t
MFGVIIGVGVACIIYGSVKYAHYREVRKARDRYKEAMARSHSVTVEEDNLNNHPRRRRFRLLRRRRRNANMVQSRQNQDHAHQVVSASATPGFQIEHIPIYDDIEQLPPPYEAALPDSPPEYSTYIFTST